MIPAALHYLAVLQDLESRHKNGNHTMTDDDSDHNKNDNSNGNGNNNNNGNNGGSNDGHSGPSKVEWVAIAIGIFVVVFLMGGTAIWLYLRRRERKRLAAAHAAATSSRSPTRELRRDSSGASTRHLASSAASIAGQSVISVPTPRPSDRSARRSPSALSAVPARVPPISPPRPTPTVQNAPSFARQGLPMSVAPGLSPLVIPQAPAAYHFGTQPSQPQPIVSYPIAQPVLAPNAFYQQVTYDRPEMYDQDVAMQQLVPDDPPAPPYPGEPLPAAGRAQASIPEYRRDVNGYYVRTDEKSQPPAVQDDPSEGFHMP